MRADELMCMLKKKKRKKRKNHSYMQSLDVNMGAGCLMQSADHVLMPLREKHDSLVDFKPDVL